MPNTYFQFKQFTVWQSKSAMKVCTDSCLFGAWVAKLVCKVDGVQRVADFGTGTGLLSLMLVQHIGGRIDAFEIDPGSVQQAQQNFRESPWHSQLNVVQADLRDVAFKHKYNVIISNPPFYENDLKTSDDKRNTALHSEALNLATLFETIDHAIEADGLCFILLPFHRKTDCMAIAASNGFYATNIIYVRQTEKHSFFRVMFCFQKQSSIVVESDISIKEGGKYSAKFINLLQDYYLHL